MRRAFADRVAIPEGQVKEKMVRVADDSSDESNDEGAEAADGDAKDGWESMDED